LKAALGARIRLYTLSSEPGWIRGTLTSVSASAITLQDAHGMRPISLADIQGAERSAGRPRWQGAIVGLVFGVGIGAVVGYQAGTHASKEFVGMSEFFSGIAGGVIGAPVGAIVGAAVTPEEWQVLVPHR